MSTPTITPEALASNLDLIRQGHAARASIDQLVERVVAASRHLLWERDAEWSDMFSCGSGYLSERYGDENHGHLFWTGEYMWLKRATVIGDKVKVLYEGTFRGEREYHAFTLPLAWLTLSDTELAAALTVESDRIKAEGEAHKAHEDAKEEWESYQRYLGYKERFDGQPAPQEPKEWVAP